MRARATSANVVSSLPLRVNDATTPECAGSQRRDVDAELRDGLAVAKHEISYEIDVFGREWSRAGERYDGGVGGRGARRPTPPAAHATIEEPTHRARADGGRSLSKKCPPRAGFVAR